MFNTFVDLIHRNISLFYNLFAYNVYIPHLFSVK